MVQCITAWPGDGTSVPDGAGWALLAGDAATLVGFREASIAKRGGRDDTCVFALSRHSAGMIGRDARERTRAGMIGSALLGQCPMVMPMLSSKVRGWIGLVSELD
jgi:hypothetical protein